MKGFLALFWFYFDVIIWSMEDLLTKRKRGRPTRKRIKTSIGMTEEAYALWVMTAQRTGQTQIGALELAVRDFAQKHGVALTKEQVAEIIAGGAPT